MKLSPLGGRVTVCWPVLWFRNGVLIWGAFLTILFSGFPAPVAQEQRYTTRKPNQYFLIANFLIKLQWNSHQGPILTTGSLQSLRCKTIANFVLAPNFSGEGHWQLLWFVKAETTISSPVLKQDSGFTLRYGHRFPSNPGCYSFPAALKDQGYWAKGCFI